MKYLLLFWGIMLAMYGVGAKTRNLYDGSKLVDRMLVIVVTLLVVQMGLNMGSNHQVIEGLQSIGVISLVMTILLWVGTIGAIMLTRVVLRMDRYGRRRSERDQKIVSDTTQEDSGNTNLMTILIIIGAVLGIAIGYLGLYRNMTPEQVEAVTSVNSALMMVVLCGLVGVVGYSMGLTGTVFQEIRNSGLRIMIFPAVVLIATGAVGFLVGVIFPTLSIQESLSISFGYGWYTFAPGVLTAAGHPIAGAISFMHNVLREIVGLVLIPVVAKKIGYIESISLPGIACMDVGLPVVINVTRQEMVAYAIAIGLAEELGTMIFTPLLVGA